MKIPTFKAPSFNAPTFKRAPLPSAARAPDPLKGVTVPDTVEAAAAVELDAVQAGFRERAAQEAARFEDATDSGYYFCAVFENRAQCEAVLSALGVLGKGDLFVDGREIAKRLGVDLPAGGGGGKPGRVNSKFASLAR